MIIFGTRGVTYNAGQGNFFCPTCTVERPYNQKRVRRFFTLYFIPVIPLDQLGEYVECGQCRDTYNMSVLDIDPAKTNQLVESEFRRAIRRTMVLMMLADNVIDDNEIETIIAVYEQLAGTVLTADEIRAEADVARQEGLGVQGYLKDVGAMLNDSGKEIVIKSAFMVAAADGDFADEEKALLAQIAAALDVSGAHLRGIIADMMEDAA